MVDKWIISDQEQLKKSISVFVSNVKNTPMGNDPEILKLLDQLVHEYNMPKHYGIMAEIIKKIFENE